ncbi:MAG TPA: DUF192 domain-containing protein [Candidatus Pacearchaeota archaeon]|nr:DUF192 domain-containing protein [Candidatus Pacearchaeota archaeon]
MAKKVLIILVFAAVIFIAGIIVSFPRKNGSAVEINAPRACLNGFCYEIEIAKTPADRARGLMFRESLGENEGMLFVFDREEKHSFWMKNTLMSLDIVWMDAVGEIVGISENTAPCAVDPCPSYVPGGMAKYVLEIVAGQVQKIGARIGDRAIIEF